MQIKNVRTRLMAGATHSEDFVASPEAMLDATRLAFAEVSLEDGEDKSTLARRLERDRKRFSVRSASESVALVAGCFLCANDAEGSLSPEEVTGDSNKMRSCNKSICSM